MSYWLCNELTIKLFYSIALVFIIRKKNELSVDVDFGMFDKFFKGTPVNLSIIILCNFIKVKMLN